ncbi:Gfo/Idh/MocA family protein [Oceanicola sp. 502str15]|uniref:Gfo/Idh/MocA family protein n=1 Tax=Oceanicola sp. 502str15 TaxID=2696061 RepID=UPI00273A5BA2|nr:Gfo/Idh/MocA family oxidoreductase [Oceanicola sp. 502str15]MCO6381978.1 Gfo/Idh/MocA family oxidoreductase [Oceanicola sp. 502str15]
MTGDGVGVALVGAGMIAKTHVAALAAAEGLALKAVVSRHPERAGYLAELCEGDAPRFISDIGEVIADPGIGMVIIATPPSVRAELIGPLAAAGKHILLEKPLGRTLAEAEAVVEICEGAGVALGVVFQHRVRAASRAAAALVAGGALGALGVVEIAVPIWRAQSYYDELGRGTYARDGGGVMITNVIHSIDLALSLTGPVVRVQGMTATSKLHRMEAEDMAVAGLSFANGAVGSFVASTAMFPNRGETISLHFEQGSLRIGRDGVVVSWRDGREEVLGAEEVAKHDWHQRVIEDFSTAIREGRAPLVTGREALASHRLIEAIETSSRDGRAVELAG